MNIDNPHGDSTKEEGPNMKISIVFTDLFKDLAGDLTGYAMAKDVAGLAFSLILAFLVVPAIASVDGWFTNLGRLLLIIAGVTHFISIVSRLVQMHHARKTV